MAQCDLVDSNGNVAPFGNIQNAGGTWKGLHGSRYSGNKEVTTSGSQA